MGGERAELTLEEERALLKRLQQRDERAFRWMVERYQHRVYNVVYRLLGDAHEAQDVTQEVFIAVFRAIDRFRGEARLSTWLYRIAMNRARNKRLYLARRPAEPLGDAEPSGDGVEHAPPDHALMGRELEEVLQRALSSLDIDQRALIVLREVEGLSYQEIMQITDLAIGTVKSRLHRARLQLKATVDAYRQGEPLRAQGEARGQVAAPAGTHGADKPSLTQPIAIAAALTTGEPSRD